MVGSLGTGSSDMLKAIATTRSRPCCCASPPFFCLFALPAWADAPAPLALTEAQRAWLQTHGPLRVGIVLQPPYAQFDRRSSVCPGPTWN